jgi:hypothetical protein
MSTKQTGCRSKPKERPTSREVLQILYSREFWESIHGSNLLVLQDFFCGTVPPELRDFLGYRAESHSRRTLSDEVLRAKSQFPVGASREEDDKQFVINSIIAGILLRTGIVKVQYDAFHRATELRDPTAMCELAIALSLSKREDDRVQSPRLMKQAADRGCRMA